MPQSAGRGTFVAVYGDEPSMSTWVVPGEMTLENQKNLSNI